MNSLQTRASCSSAAARRSAPQYRPTTAAVRSVRRASLVVRAAASESYTSLQGCKVQRATDGESVELLSLWQVRASARGLTVSLCPINSLNAIH
jgi:hypothetical protein